MSNPNEVDKVMGKYSHVPVVHEAEYTTSLENKIQSLELENKRLREALELMVDMPHCEDLLDYKYLLKGRCVIAKQALGGKE